MQDANLTVLGRTNSSNVQKVMWLLSEMALPCNRIDVGGEFGGNNELTYLQKNPTGLVPTLIDGDTAVWESNSILRYLCNRFDAAGLYPSACVQRSWIDRWMDWQLTTLGPVNAPLFQCLVRMPVEQREASVIEQHRLYNVAAFALLNDALGNRQYIAGDTLTLADIALGPAAYRWFELPIARPCYPNLQRWYELLCLRAAFNEHIVKIGLR